MTLQIVETPICGGFVSADSIKLHYSGTIYGCLAFVCRPCNFLLWKWLLLWNNCWILSLLYLSETSFPMAFSQISQDGMEMNSEMDRIQSPQLPSKTHETYELRHVQCATAIKIHAGMQATHLESGMRWCWGRIIGPKFVPNQQIACFFRWRVKWRICLKFTMYISMHCIYVYHVTYLFLFSLKKVVSPLSLFSSKFGCSLIDAGSMALKAQHVWELTNIDVTAAIFIKLFEGLLQIRSNKMPMWEISPTVVKKEWYTVGGESGDESSVCLQKVCCFFQASSFVKHPTDPWHPTKSSETKFLQGGLWPWSLKLPLLKSHRIAATSSLAICKPRAARLRNRAGANPWEEPSESPAFKRFFFWYSCTKCTHDLYQLWMDGFSPHVLVHPQC